ncbi:mandelate racemase [Amycolatopsis rhizosphaerae]|uniref:Mandelate racemase n=1 Tax=Amycolatopsis rhizosphaerae TaxID=2053003 RepID=A0A558AQ68_9PSEU|nr:enolase C-terminal domain-like protein [Amycolatopsis rhizosphaerae]TVT26376.1 mandelate racemase [Amycolatopsis rhizosphaerae]
MRIDEIEAHAFTIPTDGPGGREQDGTLTWEATTLVLVVARGGGLAGVGYTYADVSAATLVQSKLAAAVTGEDALTPAAATHRMLAAIRNVGRPGAGAMAVSAVDIALWDLKARLLGRSLVTVLPAVHDRVPVYGSGGFTNYSGDRLAGQLAGWVAQGIPRVKIKTGRDPGADPGRLAVARKAIGDAVELFTDANGALTVGQARYWAGRLAEEWGVRWFEEPVSSADLEGLRHVRERAPGGLDIAAGEYAFVPRDFLNLLQPPAVDCLQADVTRCGGITGVLGVSGLSAAHQIDLSAHCAPAVSAHAFCAVERLRHLEYFHDHTRIEALAFDGILEPVDGALVPDPGRPGLGLTVKWPDLEPYRVRVP